MSDSSSFPPPGLYRVIKTYDHNEGLSVVFRQFQASESHCRYIHGYALAFSFTFATQTLDGRGWCLDFGALKPLRAWLHENFDHTMLVALSDPELERITDLAANEMVQLRLLPEVGCEAFAAHAYQFAAEFVHRETSGRVWVEKVEVREHGGNAASFEPRR